MGISKDFKHEIAMTPLDGFFRSQLYDGVSLALRVGFSQDMFPGVSTDQNGVWPADDGALVVSVRGGGAFASN